MRHHPWRALRYKPHIDVVWTRDDLILKGADSRWYPDRSAILMDARLRQVQKRCALAHELAHEERQDVACVKGAPQELAANLMAARWLITLDALLDALRWSRVPSEVAGDLWVTEDLLLVRMKHLHRSEQGWLERHLPEEDDPR